MTRLRGEVRLATGPKPREGRNLLRPLVGPAHRAGRTPKARAKPRSTGRTGVSPVQEPEPRSWASPKGPQHVRNSVSYASCETSPKKSKGTIRRLRYVGKSHVACLLIMFLQWRLAMPHMRHENVRHATLLFRAEGVTVRMTGAGECLKE